MPVDTPCTIYQQMLPLWETCRDVCSGEEAVHEAKETYLPRLVDQSDKDYANYVKRATFYPATERTVTGMQGMIFRFPPLMKLPEGFQPLVDNIDNAGTSLFTKIQNSVRDILIDGHTGVLVDISGYSPQGLTVAESEQRNLRPIWVSYPARSIINWRETVIDNAKRLSLVVLKELVAVPGEDEFEQKSRVQYRVLDLIQGVYRVRVFVESDKTDERGKKVFLQIGDDVFPLQAGRPMSFIPFLFVGASDITPAVERPPLLNLARMNLSHYRTNADMEHGAHFAALPTMVVSGYTPDIEGTALHVGSTRAWMLPDPSASATYVEVHGPGMATLERLLDRKEKLMAVIGSRMLELQSKNVDTADRASIHRKGEESILSTLSQTASMGFQKVLQWMADWGGFQGQVEFKLNRDFYPDPMSADMLMALVKGWQAGAFSDEALFEKLQRGEIIADTTTFEEESAKPRQVPEAQITSGNATQPTGGQNG